MSDYYFDIETYAKGQKIDIVNDEIITIQYQELDRRTKQAKGELNILKSWESSEVDILRRFYTFINLDDEFNFVPIGYNIAKYDFFCLYYRWWSIGIKVKPPTKLFKHPYIDIYQAIVLCNGGELKGAKLGKFAGKNGSGAEIAELYLNKNYSAIQEYIEDEAYCFLRLYQGLLQELPSWWYEWAKKNGIII